MKNKKQGKTVLIIEDDEDLRRLYKAKLENSGMTVETAEDGKDGLAKIESLNPKVVLLDLIMPKMNGFDVMEQLKAEKKIGNTLNVIVLSALGQNDDVILAKELGAVDYMVKSSVRLEDIASKVKQYL